jgi:hypothetical protein
MKNNVSPLGFETILRLKQTELKKALETELTYLGYTPIKQKGFLYASGSTPVLLVAHLDTVHKTPVKTICYSADGNIIMSPEGIGGDDRAGVYMILQLIRSQKCHVLFCEDEETGGHGARAFAASKITPAVNYIIEMDRHGNNDAVFYGCDNPAFTKFITGFGFKKAMGSFSDISVIAPRLGIAAVNISSGYYNAHTRYECINMAHIHYNIERIRRMVQTPTSKYEYIERKFYFDSDYEQMSFSSSGKLWRMEDFGKGISKYMMPIPDTAVVEMIGQALYGKEAMFFMDADNNIYEYFIDIDAAVRAESAFAYTEDGEMLKFDTDKIERIRSVSLEQAVEMMEAV